MKLRIVAADDEPLALRRLELLLRDIDDVELVGTASGCAAAAQAVDKHRPDLVLLDIKMRDGSGLALAEALARRGGPAVIFVTAYDRFAVRAFELAAVDYVLKPAAPDRLEEAINRTRTHLEAQDSSNRIAELQSIVDSLREDEREQRSIRDPEIWVRRNATDLIRVPARLIDWIEAEGPYVRIHTGEASYLHRSSIRALEQQLEPDLFVRVHRAALVRVAAIQEVRRTRLGTPEVVLRNGPRLHAGRVYAKALRRRIRDAT
jgi:DNA-binding LytR/AlgR family response regulator